MDTLQLSVVEQAQNIIDQLQELDTVDQYCQLAHEQTLVLVALGGTASEDFEFTPCFDEIKSKRLGCAHDSAALDLLVGAVSFIQQNQLSDQVTTQAWHAELSSMDQRITNTDVAKASAQEIIVLQKTGMEKRFASEDVLLAESNSQEASNDHSALVDTMVAIKNAVLTTLQSAVHA